MSKKVFYNEDGKRIYLPQNSFVLIHYKRMTIECSNMLLSCGLWFRYVNPWYIVTSKKLPNKIYWYE